MPSLRSSATIAAFVALSLAPAACADDDVGADDPERAVEAPITADAGIEALLDDHLDEELPGVVVFVGDRDDAHLAAYGVADLDDGTPLHTDDVLRIASVTKPMVAVALLSFVEAGELDLDDLIADHLPADIVGGLANADRATVRQLLQMTSGIPDYLDTDAFWAAVDEDPHTFWTPAEVLAFADGLTAEHAPGAGFHYSNSNYILAQIILEDLGGQPLSEVLRRAVFDPAGMAECSLETADTFATTIVRGYDLGVSGDLVDVTDVNDGVGLGDGGVVCSVESLARFLPALFAGELLDEGTLDAMLDIGGPGIDDGYGLGIDVDHDGEFGFTVGHEGASSGFQAVLLYLPDDDVSVAVLTNSFASDAHRGVADDLLGWWSEER